MKLALSILLALVAACHKDAPKDPPTTTAATSAPTAPASSTGVYGWWDVADVEGAEDLRGGALEIQADHLGFVSKDRKQSGSRACPATVDGATVTITGCGPALTGTLTGDTLDFQRFTAKRTAPSRVAELVALVKSSADICDHARRCYRYAWPALGRTPNEDFDFGPGPSSDTCKNMLTGIADELRTAGKPLAACGP